jgi:hypothetical protein
MAIPRAANLDRLPNFIITLSLYEAFLVRPTVFGWI